MKSIAVFHPSAELYGADRIMVNALLNMKGDHEFHLYVPCTGPLLDFAQRKLPTLQIHVIPEMPVISRSMFGFKAGLKYMGRWFKFWRYLHTQQRLHRFELAYVNTLACSFLLPLIWLQRIPQFIHVHEILENPKIIGKLTAMLCRLFAKRVVCVSEAVESQLKAYSPSIFKKTVVLHNGIKAIRTLQSPQHDRLRFYLFGRIKPEKGQWIVTKALEMIPDALLEQCEVRIVGGPVKGQEHLVDELKERIGRAGLKHVVSLQGFTRDISGELSQADVCLVPSTMKDPFPTTVLEAMSAGKPVIACNHGGAPEAIEDQQSGLLVTPGSPRELAQAMMVFLQEPGLTKNFGTNALKRYQEHFCEEVFSRKWRAFLTQQRFISAS